VAFSLCALVEGKLPPASRRVEKHTRLRKSVGQRIPRLGLQGNSDRGLRQLGPYPLARAAAS
jgi:hypothetical protein